MSAQAVEDDGEEQRLRVANEAARAALPKSEDYADVAPDLVAGLQKRDFKLASAITPQLIEELGEALLPSFLFPLSFADGKVLFQGTLQGASSVVRDPQVAAIAERLTAFVATHLPRQAVGPQAGFFVKLSFMSPKDVALQLDGPARLIFLRRLDLFWKTLPWYRKLWLQATAPELRTVWLDSLYASLRVFSGVEALKLVLSSARCREELSDALIAPAHFTTHLVVRPWMLLRPGFEFRLFISDGALTAASQYEDAYYPEVWRLRSVLQDRIATFVKSRVIPQLQPRLRSFVCDTVLTHDDRLFVCEINPFAASTSGCLFSWSTDKKLLLIGPETWRFVPPPSSTAAPASKLLPDPWRALAARALQQHRAYFLVNIAIYLFTTLAFLIAAYLKHFFFGEPPTPTNL